MRGPLLALACISLPQLLSALPSPGEADLLPTTGFGAVPLLALKVDGTGPAPFRPSQEGASHHGSALSTPTKTTLDTGCSRGSSSGSNENNTGGGGLGDGGGQQGSQSNPAVARGPVRQPRRRKRRGHKPRNRGACQASAQCGANDQPPGSSTLQPGSEETRLQQNVTRQGNPLAAVAIERPRWTEPQPRILALSYPIVPPPSRASSRSHCGKDINGTDAVHDTSVDDLLPSTCRPLVQNKQRPDEEHKALAQDDPQPSSSIHPSNCYVESAPEQSSSSSATEAFFTLTPERVSSNAERLAAGAGFAGVGALSSCAEKHSPYALDGYSLPENLVASNDSVGVALIRLAGREIADELRQARILTKAQAQLKQNCIDLLCTPKERLLINAEAALNVAFRAGELRSTMRPTAEPEEPPEVQIFTQEELDEGYEEALAEHLKRTCRPGTLLWLLSREGTLWCMNMVKQHSAAWKLTSSEVDYAYHRFYEFAADYNFAVAMHGFLYGVRPDPRRGLPGEDALASPSVLRILATVKGNRLMEMKKRSLLSFQLGHIKFMRQLLREKRLILADLLMPPPPPSTFSTSNSPNVCLDRSAKPPNRRVARVDRRSI